MPVQSSPSPLAESPPARAAKEPPKTAAAEDLMTFRPQTGGPIMYRAIHTKTMWRKVGNHQSLESAIRGKDGAAGLFARKVRIDYAKHGDPLYVLVWESDAKSGYVIKADPSNPNGICATSVPMKDLLEFEARGQAGQRELEKYFVG